LILSKSEIGTIIVLLLIRTLILYKNANSPTYLYRSLLNRQSLLVGQCPHQRGQTRAGATWRQVVTLTKQTTGKSTFINREYLSNKFSIPKLFQNQPTVCLNVSNRSTNTLTNAINSRKNSNPTYRSTISNRLINTFTNDTSIQEISIVLFTQTGLYLFLPCALLFPHEMSITVLGNLILLKPNSLKSLKQFETDMNFSVVTINVRYRGIGESSLPSKNPCFGRVWLFINVLLFYYIIILGTLYGKAYGTQANHHPNIRHAWLFITTSSSYYIIILGPRYGKAYGTQANIIPIASDYCFIKNLPNLHAWLFINTLSFYYITILRPRYGKAYGTQANINPITSDYSFIKSLPFFIPEPNREPTRYSTVTGIQAKCSSTKKELMLKIKPAFSNLDSNIFSTNILLPTSMYLTKKIKAIDLSFKSRYTLMVQIAFKLLNNALSGTYIFLYKTQTNLPLCRKAMEYDESILDYEDEEEEPAAAGGFIEEPMDIPAPTGTGDGTGGMDPPPSNTPADNSIATEPPAATGEPTSATSAPVAPAKVNVFGSSSSSVSSMGSTYSETDDHYVFGRGYTQCKAARNAELLTEVTDTSIGKDFSKSGKAMQERTGNLCFGTGSDLLKTFRGTRVCSKGVIVNQVLSMSFDPATLLCTVCKKEHSIVPTDGSELAIILADQNFVPSLVGKSSCVPIIRMEYPSLHELFSISCEIFERYRLPVGTVFLIGSLSFLSQVGSTIYCIEWLKLLKNFGQHFGQCRVGPLPPIIQEDCPPNITKLLVEVHRWYSIAYGTDITFLGDTWNCLLHSLSKNNEQVLESATKETYTVALPISLNSSALVPIKFCSSSSIVATAALGDNDTKELLRSLLTVLNSTFGCHAHPEDFLAREPAERGGACGNAPPIILIGASHLNIVAKELQNQGHTVTNLCIPGWTPTDGNVSRLVDSIKAVEGHGDAIAILSVLSNVSYRFEQEEGEFYLPIKMGGKYHLPGKIVSSTKEQIFSALGKLKPVFDLLKGEKIFLSPLPRYLYNPCCENQDHCTNIGSEGHAPSMVDISVRIRKHTRDYLHSRFSKVWVPDALSMLVPGCDDSATVAEGLSPISAADGVHLTRDGYVLMTQVVLSLIENKVAPSICVSGGRAGGASGRQGKTFYWKGFVSPVGSSRPDNMAAYHPNRVTGKKPSTRGFHPYKKRN
jgi:hypothetical protein